MLRFRPSFVSTSRVTSSLYGRKSTAHAHRVPSISQHAPAVYAVASHRISPSTSAQFVVARCSSSNTTGGNNKSDATGKTGEQTGDGGEEANQELVLTPGEKVVAGSRLTLYAAIFAFTSVCAYYIGEELFPSKMSPNKVFDKAFDVIRDNSDIKHLLGAPLKAYGRDHGGHREGRRNFIENTKYDSQDDNSKRTRVRFNVEGQFGSAFVFAEVSSEMESGEFVYLLVQDKRNGRVISVIDNRSALTAARMSGGDKESMAAISNLLKGGGNKN